jgi:hypothetical protein
MPTARSGSTSRSPGGTPHPPEALGLRAGTPEGTSDVQKHATHRALERAVRDSCLPPATLRRTEHDYAAGVAGGLAEISLE